MTLAERYGVPNDENVTDEEWLAEVGRRGEVALMKDRRVRYNTAEKAVIIRQRVRCFCLARRDLKAEDMADRFLGNLDRIVTACAQEGPLLYAVHRTRIELLSLE